jgi:hypothetical protein
VIAAGAIRRRRIAVAIVALSPVKAPEAVRIAPANAERLVMPSGLSRWGFVLLSGILVRGLVGIIRALGCERGRNQSLGKERLKGRCEQGHDRP